MLLMLRKVGLEYLVLVSTFHFGRVSIPNWNMPSLDAFVESLIQEKDKLVQMGVIQTSKNQSLFVGDSNNAQARGKLKWREKKDIDSNPKENRESFDGALGSKKKKTKCP